MSNWKEQIKIGDLLHPLPLWNITEKNYHQLPDEVKIFGVRSTTGCESGYMFEVKTKIGTLIWLDAGWFHKPEGIDECSLE